jgi:predicted N-acetyltransferase YhbS
MSFSIRPAALDDAEQIASVLRASFAEFNGVFDPPSGALAETRESIERKLSESSAFVAEISGAIIGCVFCRPEGEDFYLYRLAVLPEHRGSGAGRTLVRTVEEEAATRGFGVVRLGTRLAVPKNVGYYQALGYEHTRDAEHPITGRKIIAVMVKRVGR